MSSLPESIKKIKNEGPRVVTSFFPLLLYGSYPLPWTPEFRSNLTQNLMQPFPHPNDGSDKISFLIGPLVAEIFEFENVHRHTARHTARHTDDDSNGIL